MVILPIRLYIRPQPYFIIRFVLFVPCSQGWRSSINMSYRGVPNTRDGEGAGIRPLNSEMEISGSPRRDTGHSRQRSESRQLLPSPRNLFEYSATSHFRFPESRQSDIGFLDWPFDPQTLRISRRQWWTDLFFDVLMMVIGLPFIALAGVVIRVNGRVTGKQELNILEQCIKGVSCVLFLFRHPLRQNRPLHYFP